LALSEGKELNCHEESYPDQKKLRWRKVKCKQRILAWRYMGQRTCGAWPSLHISGWLSGPSNVSGLTVELQRDRVLVPSFAVDGMEGRCGRSGRQKGSRRGTLGLSKPATHRAKAVRQASSGFALNKVNLTFTRHSGLAITRLPLRGP
jgi:hypothetical protein